MPQMADCKLCQQPIDRRHLRVLPPKGRSFEALKPCRRFLSWTRTRFQVHIQFYSCACPRNPATWLAGFKLSALWVVERATVRRFDCVVATMLIGHLAHVWLR